jgi:hypothetical protein
MCIVQSDSHVNNSPNYVFDLLVPARSASVWGKVYNFVTRPDNSIQVIEVDGSTLPAELGELVEPESRNLNQEPLNIPSIDLERKQTAGDDITIDVMCLYTPQSVCLKATGTENCDASDPNNYKIMDSLCKLSVYETNVAFEASGAQSMLNLVYSGLISPDYEEEEGEEMCRPLQYFKSSNEDTFLNVRKLRDQYGADLVSLIVSRGAWCGCADIYTGKDRDAFSVVHEKCATG